MLKKDRDWTDEGIEKLKKLMVDREIPSIVDAADLSAPRKRFTT